MTSSIDRKVNSHILPFHTYLDKKSFEVPTRTIKQKYKLACQAKLSTYIFLVLTSDPSTCKTSLTFKIDQGEWENRQKNELTGTSHCDVTKYDVLSFQDIFLKIIDDGNKFLKMGNLPPNKVVIFKTKLTEAQQKMVKHDFSPFIQDQINSVVEGLLGKLGLN